MIRLGGLGFLLLISSAMVDTNQVAAQREAGVSGIDHIIVGINNLEHGVRQIEDLTGVKPVIGGTHPGRGTRNALMSLGATTYLEILAPVPDGKLSDEMSYLASLTEGKPVGWAIATTDIERTAQLLKSRGYEVSPPMPGSRVRPDGGKLEWRSLNIIKPKLALVPFFIQWGDTTLHPAKSSPSGCTLMKVELSDPESTALKQLVQAINLDVAVGTGSESNMKVTMNCPKGRVVLGR